MKNWMLWSFVVLALGCLGASSLAADEITSDLFTPAPEPKIICERCLGFYSTAPSPGVASAWGFGANCTAAQSDLDNQLWDQADLACFNMGHTGACSLTTVVTGACHFDSGHNAYQVDGYANFKCSVWLC